MSFNYITMALRKNRKEETMKVKTIMEDSVSRIKSTVITPQPISVKSGEALEKYEACYFHILQWEKELKISSDGHYLWTRDNRDIHLWNVKKERVIKVFENIDKLSHKDKAFLKSFNSSKYDEHSSDILIEGEESHYVFIPKSMTIVDKEHRRWNHSFYSFYHYNLGEIILSEKKANYRQYMAMSLGDISIRALPSSLAPTVLKKEQYSDYIFSKSELESYKIWNREKKKLKYVDFNHAENITSVAISQDGRYMVSGASSSFNDVYICLNLWDLETGLLIKSFVGARDIHSVVISSDGCYIISGSGCDSGEGYSSIQIWDIKNEKPVYSINNEDSYGLINFIGISLDGKSIVAQKDKLNVWDISHLQESKDLRGNAERVEGLALSPDGQYLVSLSLDNVIRVWDKKNHQLVESFLVEKDLNAFSYCQYYVEDIAISNDNRYIGIRDLVDEGRVWDREEQKIYTKHEIIKSFNFLQDKSENYSLIVLENVIKLEKIGGESVILESLSGKELRVIKAILSPNEMYVVVGTGYGKILVWDIKKEKVIQTIEAHKEMITALATTSDGREVISGSTDGTIRVHNINDNTLKQEYIGGQRGNWFVRDFEAQKVYKGDDGDFLFEKREVYRNGDSVVFEVNEFSRED